VILHPLGHRRFTILVVEDEPRAREALGATLREEGHCVIVASTGKQALDMAPGSEADLVLLDLGASETDGLATLRALRTLGQATPVVLLTAEGTLRGAREAMALGAYDYITKPVDLEFVTSVIQEALEAIPGASREAVCAH
jgi:DNA-binding response OmpR family regulator